jgi:hypothetical protein
MVNLFGMLIIFLVLLQSVISPYLSGTLGRERLSWLFDRVSVRDITARVCSDQPGAAVPCRGGVTPCDVLPRNL